LWQKIQLDLVALDQPIPPEEIVAKVPATHLRGILKRHSNVPVKNLLVPSCAQQREDRMSFLARTDSCIPSMGHYLVMVIWVIFNRLVGTLSSPWLKRDWKAAGKVNSSDRLVFFLPELRRTHAEVVKEMWFVIYQILFS
jgi:hypothetical protein